MSTELPTYARDTQILERSPLPGRGRSIPRSLSLLSPWVTRGGLAIVDQGLTSGSNFLVSILLARWLSPGEYGAYALAFSIYLLLLLLYQSLLLEPMTVFGGAGYRNCLRGYFGSLLRVHIALAATVFTALAIVAAVARGMHQGDGLPGALAGIALAAPCILLFWLARRVFYLQLNIAYAAGGSALYCVMVIAGLSALYHYKGLTSFSAFALMGVAALVTSLVLLFRIRARLADQDVAPSLTNVWNRHWLYGRWAVLGCLAGWIPAYVYYPIISSFHGMQQAGELKALLNLDLPLQQTYAALSLLFLPFAARTFAERGSASTKPLAFRMTLLFTATAVAYWFFIIPFKHSVFRLLYSGKYSQVTHLLPLIAVQSIIFSAICGPALVLRAMESPSSVFIARSVAALISITVGVVATRLYGLSGVLWAITLSGLMSFVAAIWLLRTRESHVQLAAGRAVCATDLEQSGA